MNEMMSYELRRYSLLSCSESLNDDFDFQEIESSLAAKTFFYELKTWTAERKSSNLAA